MRLLLWGGLVLGMVAAAVAADEAQPDGAAAAANRRLGRGVNLGNALEAPKEGEWGLSVREEYLQAIADAGFQSIRLPVRWSAHAADKPPYAIDPEFFRRIDQILDQAHARKLNVVLNVHHYDEMNRDPQGEKARFLALWRQIAERYRGRPDDLYFELLNEPNTQLTAETWNAILKEALALVRQSNPERFVIVGPTQWNAAAKLPTLELPEEDRRLIATFHYYLPFHFTHQGAPWTQGAEAWRGTKWEGTDAEKQALRADFDKAAAWADQHRRPLYLGEFGSYHVADRESRVRWTQFVRETAEQRHISWAYWEFGAGFGLYDPQTNTWRKPLLDALIPQSDPSE